jgi:tetratricopeptide (TPR) repeat protein
MAPPPLPGRAPPVPNRPKPAEAAQQQASLAATAPAVAQPSPLQKSAPSDAHETHADAPRELPTLAVELSWRADRLTQKADPIAASRALVERGLYEQRVELDLVAAKRSFAAARSISHSLGPALVRLRHLLDPQELNERVAILDEELVVVETDAERADLLTERARALTSLGNLPEARAAYTKALDLIPHHPSALRGKESVLRQEIERGQTKELADQLAKHLERMADAYAPQLGKTVGDAVFSAWLHVERAAVLDDALGQPQQAAGALEKAVALQPAPGPVRASFGRHHIRHDNPRALSDSLAAEAEHETEDHRASRLLYAAARIGCERLKDLTDGAVLLGRAASRAPGGLGTTRRILAEQIRVQEHLGAVDQSIVTRLRELTMLTSSHAIAHAQVRLSEIHDSLGQAEDAAAHAEQALLHDPTDESTRERLDRALQRLGRHERRIEIWVAESHDSRPTPHRVSSLLRAADICERHLKRRDDALTYLRAAWSVHPGDASVFDTLSGLLAQPVRDADPSVRARIDLFTLAAQAANDTPRKIALLEKVASIWEEELGQSERALEVLEQIHGLDRARRTTILGLQRNALRANDHRRLSRSLVAEADLTEDSALARRLLISAADVCSERLNDRDRALELIDRALEILPSDPDALRARFRLLVRAGRHEPARNALLGLIRRDPANAFGLWVEVARFDEQRLKKPQDAVAAYEEAARLRPEHPLPAIEIARLLRTTGDHRRLCDSLRTLAKGALASTERVHFLVQAAEVEELLLSDDRAALMTLAAADTAASETGFDASILESMERILVRKRNIDELIKLYTKWLTYQPAPAIDHAIRVALAEVLYRKDKHEAINLLEGLVSVVPNHLPALRRLEHLYRGSRATKLADALRAQAAATSAVPARTGALEHLVTLEGEVSNEVLLDALSRVVAERPDGGGAHDAITRICSRLVADAVAPGAPNAVAALLLASISARKSLVKDSVSRAFLQIEEAMLVEASAATDVTRLRLALVGYHDALTLWPDSLLAARGLERLAEQLKDREALITANRALARLVDSSPRRAGHFVRAAQLTAEEPGLLGAALDLYEQALHEDADCDAAVLALARGLATEPIRLVDRLGAALERARKSTQIVLLGMEIGKAVLRHFEAGGATPDPSVGTAAMRRALAVAPDDAAPLMLSAKLYSAQRLHSEARDAWQRVVTAARHFEIRITAYFELATLFEGPLNDLARAEDSIRAILEDDESHAIALERLFQIATKRGDRALAIQALSRLAEASTDPRVRVDVDLRLAEVQREGGDRPSMVRTLCDAIAFGPNDPRPMSVLQRLYRIDTPDGAASYASALAQVLEIASSRRLPIEPRWLTSLGLLEVTILLRHREGLARLQAAVNMPTAQIDARAALGRGLEAANRNAEAVQVLRDALGADIESLTKMSELSPTLAALESALAKDGRAEERLSVEEARGCLGDVKPERIARLRARRIAPEAFPPGALAGPELYRVLVPEVQNPMLSVAAAISPIAAKALRFELGTLGVSSRERVGSRDNNAVYRLVDRIAKCIGLESFELYLSPNWQGMPRIYPGDPPAIVAHPSVAELPEPEQAFSIGRLLVRATLGPVWLDELTPEAIDGLLVGALRAVEPTFGVRDLGPTREPVVQAFAAQVQRAMGRRQRKLLEEILPTATVNYDTRAFIAAVRRGENRLGYLLSGDLIAAIDHMCRLDRDVARAAEDPRLVVMHPATGDLLRYALGGVSYAERKRIGTVWTSV